MVNILVESARADVSDRETIKCTTIQNMGSLGINKL